MKKINVFILIIIIFPFLSSNLYCSEKDHDLSEKQEELLLDDFDSGFEKDLLEDDLLSEESLVNQADKNLGNENMD